MRAPIQIIILLLLLLCSVPGAHAQSNGGGSDIGYNFEQLRGLPPFRDVPWGASKKQVLNKDKSERKETGKDYLVLANTLDGVDVDITYFFWRDHFIKGVYLTTENLGEYSGYYDKYERFKDLLSQKYGNPKIDLTNWVDVTYKNRPEKWLVAISRGHLEHFAIWEQEDIVISIKFSAVNDRPSVKIEYFIKNFDAEMDETDDFEVLKDL